MDRLDDLAALDAALARDLAEQARAERAAARTPTPDFDAAMAAVGEALL